MSNPSASTSGTPSNASGSHSGTHSGSHSGSQAASNHTLRDFSSDKLIDLSDDSTEAPHTDPEASTLQGIQPPNASRMPKWLGKRVGNFRLVSLLGHGSWGKVFEAEDTTMKRRVALKILAAVNAKGKPTADFGRVKSEARAAASLEHPNNIGIYEVGRHGDFFYIAMELAEGGSIDEQIRTGGPLDVPRACTLAAEAADALDVAHECGIYHRDIKPGNLLLTRTGRCKLTDFGLAAGGNPSDPLHATRAAGTAHYVAPEVVRGAEANGKSDIYSLGFTVYHMLSGRRPFENFKGRNDVLKAQLHKEPPTLEQMVPGIDPQLSAAVAKAMSKDPGQRYTRARDFARVLRRFAVAVPQTAPVTTAAPATPAGPSKAAALKQWWPALVGVAAILAIGIAIALNSLSGGSQISGADLDDIEGPGKPGDTGGTTPPKVEDDPIVKQAVPTEPEVKSKQEPKEIPTEPAKPIVIVPTHTFQLDTSGWDNQPNSVHVVGDFNEWNQTEHRLTDTNHDLVWSIDVQLEPGMYLYKFLLDRGTENERWLNDPAADKGLEKADGHGGVNSAVEITR